MFSIIKSEFRKFVTVRSTYFVTAGTLALTCLISFIVAQQQGTLIDSASYMQTNAIFLGISMLATFAGILAILHVAHEYRYNTITYTLTAANRRIKVFLAKALVVTVYALIAGVLVGFASYWAARWGISIKHVSIVDQSLPVWPLIWQMGAYVLANTFVAFLLAWLTRSLVASIVAFFFIPVVEQLCSLFMHDNARFLPFSLMDQFTANSGTQAMFQQTLSPIKAVGIFSAYLAITTAVTIFLYTRRDAN